MSMEINSAYNNYANAVNSREQETKKTSKEKSALEKLQEKYSGFDIKTGVVTQSSISSSAKGFQGVTINSAFLAKAENDEETAKKLDEMLSGVEEAQKWKQNVLSKNGLNLISSGFYIDENGNMSSWSVVEKKNSIFDGLKQQSEEAADRLKEKKEKEKAEKKEDEKKAEEKQQEKKLSNDKTVIFAKSNEEMLRKAKEIVDGDDDKVKSKEEKAVGSNFDLSI